MERPGNITHRWPVDFIVWAAMIVLFLDIMCISQVVVVAVDGDDVDTWMGPCKDRSVCCSSGSACSHGTTEDVDVKDMNCTLNNNLTDHLVALSTRDIDNHWVGLNISWTSAIVNDSVIYDVVVAERSSLESEDYRDIYEQSVTGVNITVIILPNLLAFWDYRVSVQARTETTNCTSFGPVHVKTLTNSFQAEKFGPPGVVQNLKVLQDALLAAHIVITFDCPEEKTRNGTVIAFIISKTLVASRDSLPQQREIRADGNMPDAHCNYTVTADDVGSVVVEQNYTFEIKTVNQDYIGNLSAVVNIYIAPRAPRLSHLSPSTVISATSPVGLTPGGTTLDVIISSRNLTDSGQGTVTALGLVVCVVSENSSCSDCDEQQNMDVALNFSSFSTWACAVMASFSMEYRSTPDDWHLMLQNSSDTMIFTLGSDVSCNISQASEYCNGPLPYYKDITISVIKCNLAGCGCVTSKDVFTTKTRNAPKFNTVGLGVGIAMGCALILTLIIMNVVSCVTGLRANRKRDLQRSVNIRESRKNSSQSEICESTTDSGARRKSNISDTTNLPSTSGVGGSTSDVSGNTSMTNVSDIRRTSRSSGQDDDIEVLSKDVVELPSLESRKLEKLSRRGSSRRISLGSLM